MAGQTNNRPTELVERHARPLLVEALRESRAVALLGARQTGKSTLVRELSQREFPAELFNLDNTATANTARSDPEGFVASIDGPAVIDEIQRVPDLLLAIKQRVDGDRARGQFLLTGSADILTLPTIADALPGRVEYVNLWPFSQGELRRHRETFIDDLFEGAFPRVSGAPVGRQAVAELLAVGGYPEVQDRSPRGRSRFFSSYIASMLGRDLEDVATVRNVGAVERLLRVVAARSAGLANFLAMSRDLGVDGNTVKAHTRILESLFLVHQLKPWHANLGSRMIKSPKIHVVDSGLLAFLIGASDQRIVTDGAVAGAMVESFVAMELLRQAEWANEVVTLFHYRDKKQREVDIVAERNSGDLVGVEAKVAATVGTRDFAGLRYLRDRLGRRFKAGVVLYTGGQTLPFGDRLAAVPMSGLWT